MNDLPTHVSEADLLRLKLSESQLSEARAHLKLAELQHEAAKAALRQRYQIEAGDTLQLDGTIVRAARPAKEGA